MKLPHSKTVSVNERTYAELPIQHFSDHLQFIFIEKVHKMWHLGPLNVVLLCA